MSELDVIDFVFKKGNGVKGLSDMALESVPEHYVLPIHDRIIGGQQLHHHYNTKEEEEEEEEASSSLLLFPPIIDVSNWHEEEEFINESICEAARKHGFFQIINHGIPMEVLDNVLEAGHRFFALPNEDRRNYFFPKEEDSDSTTVRLKTGYVPHADMVLEWLDYLTHTYTTTTTTIPCEKNNNDNYFVPLEEQLNDLPIGFSTWPSVSRDQVLEYMKWAKPVIKKLLEVLLKGLNVEKIDESNEKALMGTLIVNLTYYPKCPNPDLTHGVGPHADVSTITVVLQDDTGGLYVRGKEENVWIPVEPVKGALVVNIGDILQIMSNDRYHSIEHRVNTNSSKHRVSVPIFVNPAPEAVVGTLDEALDFGEKPIYKPIIYSDYFKYFFSKPHDGKQTIEYAKI